MLKEVVEQQASSTSVKEGDMHTIYPFNIPIHPISALRRSTFPTRKVVYPWRRPGRPVKSVRPIPCDGLGRRVENAVVTYLNLTKQGNFIKSVL